MKLWEEVALAVGLVVVLVAGVFMSIFGVAGVSYIATTGHSVQQTTTWSVIYGAILVVGLALVYMGIKKASPD